jgi:hypothetical protein
MVRGAVSGKTRIESLIESVLTTVAGGRGVRAEYCIMERVKVKSFAETQTSVQEHPAFNLSCRCTSGPWLPLFRC